MRDFVMKWVDMEYTGHRIFFYVFVVVPEVSQQFGGVTVAWPSWSSYNARGHRDQFLLRSPMLVVEYIAPAPAL